MDWLTYHITMSCFPIYTSYGVLRLHFGPNSWWVSPFESCGGRKTETREEPQSNSGYRSVTHQFLFFVRFVSYTWSTPPLLHRLYHSPLRRIRRRDDTKRETRGAVVNENEREVVVEQDRRYRGFESQRGEWEKDSTEGELTGGDIKREKMEKPLCQKEI